MWCAFGAVMAVSVCVCETSKFDKKRPDGLTTGPNQNAPAQIPPALDGELGSKTGLPAAHYLQQF